MSSVVEFDNIHPDVITTGSNLLVVVSLQKSAG